jgi:hypothetical protein
VDRTIEIWFALAGNTLYMLAGSGEQAHWVRNLRKTPSVKVRIGGEVFEGVGHLVRAATDEEALARHLLVEKYTPRYSGDLSEWGRTALPVAVDLRAAPTPRE